MERREERKGKGEMWILRRRSLGEFLHLLHEL